MSLKFYIDKAGGRSFVQAKQVVEVDAFDTLVFLFPSTSTTASIVEAQASQSEAIVAKKTYKLTLVESQSGQTEAITGKETYTVSLVESQSSQSETVSAYTYSLSIIESQTAQTEVITANVGSLSITASISEAQAEQTEGMTVTLSTKTWGGWFGSRKSKQSFQAIVSEAQSAQTESGAVSTRVQSDTFEAQSIQIESVYAIQEFLYGWRETQEKQAASVEVRQGNAVIVAGGQKEQASSFRVDVWDETDDEEVLSVFMRTRV